MKCDLVFNGSSVKGNAFIGAISKLSEEGYTWNNIAGTSSGSIVASLLVSGYSPQELKDIITSLDYSTLLSRDSKFKIPYITDILSIKKNKGVYNGDALYQWIHSLLKAKGIEKFKDVCDKNGQSRLKIISADIQNQKIVIFPDSLVEYGINPMEFEIAKAVRASTAIPLFFQPLKLDYKDKNSNVNKTSYFVDGGLVDNGASWIWDISEKPTCPTFMIKIGSQDTYNYITSKTPIKNYLSCTIDTMIDRNEDTYMRDKDSIRTIYINGCNVSTFDFKLTHDEAMDLYNKGYKATEKFLKTWDFQFYINKYRTPTNSLTSNQHINKKHHNKRRKDKRK